MVRHECPECGEVVTATLSGDSLVCSRCHGEVEYEDILEPDALTPWEERVMGVGEYEESETEEVPEDVA